MDISRYLPFMKKKAKKPSSQSTLFFKLKEKYPRVSFGLNISIAIAGILFLCIFPFILLTFPSKLSDAAIHTKEFMDWIYAVILFFIILLGGAFTWSIYKLKFPLPTGLTISEELFPEFFKLVEELKEEFKNPKIDNIIVRDHYEVRIIKTPRTGLPFLTKRTLIIGMPVLLTMPPLYFRALLARKIGQLSAKHTPVTSWLYYLNDIWPQFKTSSKKSKNAFTKILSYFFQFYTPIYQTMLKPLMQEEELEADSYGMDVINGHDMVECLIYDETVTNYLKTKYWPSIYQMAKRSKTPEFLPFSQMTKVIKTGITNEVISKTIQDSLNDEANNPAHIPSLKKRLNHLGQVKAITPKPLNQTAAELLLGANLGKAIQLFDKRWLAKNKKKT